MTTPQLKRFLIEAAGVVAFCFGGAWAVGGCGRLASNADGVVARPLYLAGAGNEYPSIVEIECLRSTREPVAAATPGHVEVTCVPRADGGAR